MSGKRNYLIESIEFVEKNGYLNFTDNDGKVYYINCDDIGKLVLNGKEYPTKGTSKSSDIIKALSKIIEATFNEKYKIEFYNTWDSKNNKLNTNSKRFINILTDFYIDVLKQGPDSINSYLYFLSIGSFETEYNTSYDNLDACIDTIILESIDFYDKLNGNRLNINYYKKEKFNNGNKKDEERAADDKKVPYVKTNKPLNTRELDVNGIIYENLNEKRFITNPAIGREKEIRKLGSILLSPLNSPILLGEAGVGKTAVVEGLAYAIQNLNISPLLNDIKILQITSNGIVSGTKYRGDFEKKMEVLLRFLKNNPDVVLYLDEFHTAKNAGTSEGSSNDLINILKPYIGNGTTKIIGATTTEEYEKYLKPDRAFDRRFKTIKIDEPNDMMLRNILETSINKYEVLTGIKFGTNEFIKELMLDYLIDITNYSNRNQINIKYNPALALSIISDSFGYAQYDMQEEINPDYLIEASTECEDLMQESIKSKTKSLSLKSLVGQKLNN